MSDGADVVMFPKMFTRPRLTIDRLAGRLGRFGITDETLENWPDIVLQAGRWAHGCTVYIAISEKFDRMEDTRNPVPAYEWRFEEGVMRPHRLSHGA